MNATEDLRSEHGGVLKMLGIMDAMAEGERADRRTERHDLDSALEFLRVFVDSCHHSKEEELLFPAMQESGPPASMPVIEQLLAEHNTGRAVVADLADAVAAGVSGEELAAILGNYSALLRRHIAVEESQCFDAADESLPEDTQKRLVEGYDRIEREVVGQGRHEQFHEMLDELEAKYVRASA